MPKRKPNSGILKARSQHLIIDFLNADLDMAFTLLATVRNENGDKPDHYEEAFDKARIALESIRRFQGRIDDPEAWETVRNRAHQLEAEHKLEGATRSYCFDHPLP